MNGYFLGQLSGSDFVPSANPKVNAGDAEYGIEEDSQQTCHENNHVKCAEPASGILRFHRALP